MARRRDRPVLDARLAEPGVRSPRATRPVPRKGLTRADLPDHAYWEQWFPADWVSEMREQIRLWFYSQLFMSVVLTGRAPFGSVLGYEKMLDETGREMHGSWGNLIEAEEAFERMGADVMRWQYCAQPPDRNLLFGYGPGARDQAQAAHALELGPVPRRLREHRGLRADVRDARRRARRRAAAARPLARRAHATRSSPRRRAALDAQLTHRLMRAFEAFVDDLSNWYIRRSRRRFYDDDEAAFCDALVRARPGAARGRAGDAVPRRAPVAEPRRRRVRGRAGIRSPGRLAGAGGRARRDAARARSTRYAAWSSSGGRRARRGKPEAAAAAAAAGRRRARPRRRRTRTRSPTSCA